MAVIKLIQEQLDFGIGKITVSMDRALCRTKRAWNSGRHVSSSYELHMVLTGAAEFGMQDHLFLLQEDRGILLSPGHPHYARSFPGAFERFYVHFQLEGKRLIQAMFPDGEPCKIFMVSPQTREAARLILSELAEEKSLSQKAIRAGFHLLFVYLLRDLGLEMEKSGSGEVHEEIRRRNAIDTFFGSQMPFGCSKERLARELGVSERQLGRILQELYGKNFREMLLQSRMENAAWMLRSQDVPVKNVARALKYASEVAFCQAFHEWHGMTPSEYRKLHKKTKNTEL